jgi:AcrR family transcriptional regulator
VTASTARRRILDTVNALLYRGGSNGVGVDPVVARSGIAEMTLRRHSRSKEELAMGFLEKVSSDTR